LQGGHHFAPQYNSSGLFSDLARSSAASISASLAAGIQATALAAVAAAQKNQANAGNRRSAARPDFNGRDSALFNRMV
jgi:hypothetical protein